MPQTPHLWDRQWFRDTILLLIVFLLLWAAYSLRAILLPIIMALALAYAFHPLISWLHQRARIPRWLSTTGLLAITSAMALSLILWLMPQLINQTRKLLDKLPGYTSYATERLESIQQQWVEEDEEDPQGKHDNAGESGEAAATGERDQRGEPDGAARPIAADQPLADGGAPGAPEASAAPEQAVGVESSADARQAGQAAPAGQSATSLPVSSRQAKDGTAGPGQADAPLSTPSSSDAHMPAGQPISDGKAGLRHPSQGHHPTPVTPSALSSALGRLDVSTISSMLVQTFNVGLGVVGLTVSIGTYVALAGMLLVLGFFFFSWRFDRILQWFDTFIPDDRRPRIMQIVGRMDKAISAFVRGRLVQVSILMCVLCVGWAWVGVPYWLLLGVLGGLLNIVPYAAVISWPLAILLMWIDTASSGSTATFSIGQVFIWPSVVYIFAQSLDGWVIEPLVQGKATNLDPFSVLVAVIVGGSLLGILGTIIAVPAAACMKIMLEEVILPYIRKQIHGPPSGG